MKSAKLFAVFTALMLLCSCGTVIDDSKLPTASDTPGISDAPVKQAYPVSIYGVTFEEAPSAIASLSPAVTRTLTDIGVTDKIVGISEYCTLDSTGAITVGSPANPDIDKIIASGADTVITLSPLASTDIITLDQAGVKTVVISEPESYAELCEIYINLAMTMYGSVDSKDIAYSALSGLDTSLLNAKNAGISVKFICVTGTYDDGIIVCGGNTLESDILDVYGENLLAECESHYLDSGDAEALLPEVVFLYDTASRTPIEKLYPDAFIVRIDADIFERPSADISVEVDYCTQKLLEKLT